MRSTKKSTFSEADIQKIHDGFNHVTEMVGLTYGRDGANVVIASGQGLSPSITNDGVSVARGISLEDELEDIGAGFARTITASVEKENGDGTTTSMVFARELMKLKELPPQEDFDSLLAFIREQKDESATKEQIAITSAQSERLAQYVLDAIELSQGDPERIMLERGWNQETEIIHLAGYKTHVGFTHPIFNFAGSNRLDVDGAQISVFQGEVSDIKLLSKFGKQGPVLVVATKFTEEFVTTAASLFLSQLQRSNGSPLQNFVIPVVVSTDYELADLCKLSGSGLNQNDQLAKKPVGEPFSVVTITTDHTLFVNPSVPKDIIEEYAKGIEDNERRSRLLSGSVTIRVNGPSVSVRDYDYRKIEDTRNAVKAFLKDGAIPGGVSYVHKYAGNDDLKRILESMNKANSGISVEDAVAQGVYDPLHVHLNSLRIAYETVKQIKTVKGAITPLRSSYDRPSHID